MPLDELHIASLVVHAVPCRLDAVAGAIATQPDAEIHASTANGKLIVTLEAPTAAAMTARVADLQRLDGELSAALVYQCADSLDAMSQEMPHA